MQDRIKFLRYIKRISPLCLKKNYIKVKLHKLNLHSTLFSEHVVDILACFKLTDSGLILSLK